MYIYTRQKVGFLFGGGYAYIYIIYIIYIYTYVGTPPKPHNYIWYRLEILIIMDHIMNRQTTTIGIFLCFLEIPVLHVSVKKITSAYRKLMNRPSSRPKESCVGYGLVNLTSPEAKGMVSRRGLVNALCIHERDLCSSKLFFHILPRFVDAVFLFHETNPGFFSIKFHGFPTRNL